MLSVRLALAAPLLLVASPVNSAEQVDPLRFFEGRTVSEGTVKVLLRKSYKSRSVGTGTIGKDGSLTLVQQVNDERKGLHERRWRVWRKGDDRFTATMSEAVGPVAIEKVGGSYRFRFAMKGNLKVEQVLTPHAGGRSARNMMKIRRLGVLVATSEGTIRKV